MAEPNTGPTHDEPPKPAPVLSTDELHLAVFIIRCARAIGFLQRVAPSSYLPPPEDRVPPELLHRLIHELRTLLPKWRWTPSTRPLARNPAKLGDAFFNAITALRMSRQELLGGGYRECVGALDEAYGLLFSIGVRGRERKRRERTKEQYP